MTLYKIDTVLRFSHNAVERRNRDKKYVKRLSEGDPNFTKLESSAESKQAREYGSTSNAFFISWLTEKTQLCEQIS